jgi:hypothetical protein
VSDDLPYFPESEDVGCQVMRLSRKVMEQGKALDEVRAEVAELRGRRCEGCSRWGDRFDAPESRGRLCCVHLKVRAAEEFCSEFAPKPEEAAS